MFGLIELSKMYELYGIVYQLEVINSLHAHMTASVFQALYHSI